MLYDNKVIEIFYIADDFCNFFNEIVKKHSIEDGYMTTKQVCSETELSLCSLDYVKISCKNKWDNVKYLRIYDSDYVKSIIFALVIKDIRYG